MLPGRSELLPWMIRFIDDREHANGISVLPEYAWDFRVLGGLVERVRRAARAYLLLEKAGHAAEGRALVRSALEHAVTAQWAYLTAHGVDRLEVWVHRARVDYARRSRDKEDPEWDSLIADLENKIPRDTSGEPRRSMPRLTGNPSILASLDDTGYFRRAYAVLSRAGHVTDQAVTDYFLDDAGTVAVASGPSDEHDIDVFYTLATCCCLAAWVLARLEGDDEAQRLAMRQGLLWRLDFHLPDAERRFPSEHDAV
jgi:hypothetical protein